MIAQAVPTNTEWQGKGTWRSKCLDGKERKEKFEQHMAQLRSVRRDIAAKDSFLASLQCGDVPHVDGAIRAVPHLTRLRFCPQSWLLREAFLKVAGLPDGTDLENLHNTLEGLGVVSASCLDAKRRLLAPFADEESCRPFQDAFDAFVTGVVAPEFGKITGAGRFLFQAFPCIRISQPCNFPTIRPHIDRAYGHPRGSVNVWLPFTSTRRTNTLFIESSPGTEDFQPLEMEYSEAVLGNMNECAHFTVPNGTDNTRVSLDFRIVPWQCWEMAMKECSAPNDEAGAAAVPYQLGKYYSECRKADDGSWLIVPETAGYACSQHGFPHKRK